MHKGIVTYLCRLAKVDPSRAIATSERWATALEEMGNVANDQQIQLIKELAHSLAINSKQMRERYG